MNLKTKIIALLFCINISLPAAESSDILKYYPEFEAALIIVNTLHELVNETNIEVTSRTILKDGSLTLQCNPDWNTTDRGLIVYFEEEHPTKIYTPFGSMTVFGYTYADTKWNHVIEKFKKTCSLNPKPFSPLYTVKDSYPVVSVNQVSLPQPTKLLHGNQKRQTILAECIAKFIQEGGTLTELESYRKRTKRSKELKKATRSAQQSTPIWPLGILVNMFDLSN